MSTKKTYKLPDKMAYCKGIYFSEGKITNNLGYALVTNLGLKTYSNLEEKNLENDKDGVVNPIQSAEKVYLKEGDDFLNVQYSLKITGIETEPHLAKNLQFFKDFRDLAEKLKSENEEIIHDIAKAIAYNIVIGGIGFKNRRLSTNVRTKIKSETYNKNSFSQKEFDFTDKNYRLFSMAPFGRTLKDDNTSEIDNPDFDTLVEIIYHSLKGDMITILKIETSFELGAGSQVYPSELFKGKKAKDTDKCYYRTLASDKKSFGFTPEKLWNAVRTFDSFFNVDAPLDVIPVEPNGANLKTGSVLRTGKNTFYKLVERSIDDMKNEKELTLSDEEIFYMLAVFLRGGLFQGGSSS